MAREQDRTLTDAERAEYDRSLEEFRQHKREQHQKMLALQSLPYEIKVRKAKQRIREFIQGCDDLGYNTHVSVGGLDSITLLCLIRSMNIDIPAVSVSLLEDKSIVQVHKQLGVIMLRPLKNKHEILQEEGFPVISKKIATKIMALQDPTEANATIRHAIITGECAHAKRTSIYRPYTSHIN